MGLFPPQPWVAVETRTFDLPDSGQWVRVERDQAGHLRVFVLTYAGRELFVLDTSSGQARALVLDPKISKGSDPFRWRTS